MEILKQKIKNDIYEIIKDLYNQLDIEIDNIKIEYPQQKKFGDYSSPIAMELVKKLKKNPRIIADEIINQIKKKDNIFEKIEIAGPGFINFFINNKILEKYLIEIYNNKSYGKNILKSDDKIIMEYVSANPTGPLHIGHGRWAAIGDSLSNVMKYTGLNLFREFYVNDAGNQIKLFKKTIEAVKQNKPVPENGYHGDYIKDIAKTDKDPVEYILNEQKQDLNEFRVKFDNFFSETKLHKNNEIKNLITFLNEKKSVYNKDDALWFNSVKYGDDKDRVLIKEDESYTYFAVDIAYHYDKFKRGFNKFINIFGADHHGYVNRLKAAINLFSNNTVTLNIIIGQLVSLFRNGQPVRMSKRTGEIITLKEVIDEIGVDACRYYLTMRSSDTPLEFDIEQAKKKSNENPVYYIQYAYARIASVFQKAKTNNISFKSEQFDYKKIKNEIVNTITVELIRFPELLADISQNYEIHKLNNYLYNLSGYFHKFYYDNIIVDLNNLDKTKNYLIFAGAVQNVLKIGLNLLKISAPEKM